MLEATSHLGQLLTVLILALALGMDAFSLGVAVGMKGVRLNEVLRISTVVALFHMVMPLLGMFTGHFMGEMLGHAASYAAGVLLILLGCHMIYNSIYGNGVQILDYRSTAGVILYSLGVSMDSFSVGVTLGMFRSDLLLTIAVFGAAGGLMSVLGLLLGGRVSRNLGDYGEAIGGAVLFAFGIMFIF
ncbi:manganese efflux pump MntP family protein [Paenibacillus sp. P96]|uniref:Putative manganese efflux pump MntP n=1 Tax=Paenibacillus zeirhizosphaerae TaxID=2987519 RepID=A0ABT9FMZ4_9BACL|nr:manganese efflux pump [Paenibacillus sp. P96]MDP4096106.1 manganese efflux pump MntP family protein [Paenibacillus sp. P96]